MAKPPKTYDDYPEFLTILECAELLKICKMKIRGMIYEGTIKIQFTDGAYLIPKQQFVALRGKQHD